jgi:hypothetical protein
MVRNGVIPYRSTDRSPVDVIVIARAGVQRPPVTTAPRPELVEQYTAALLRLPAQSDGGMRW